MRELNDDLLQRYFDGDLDDEKADEVRVALESDEALARRFTNLERLHGLFAETGKAIGDDVDADDLFAKIRAGIDDNAIAGKSQPLRSVDSNRPKSTPSGRPFEDSERDVRRVATLPDRRGSRAYLFFAAAVAAAAMLAIVFRPKAGDPEAQRPEVMVEDPTQLIIETPHGSEVVEVDFGGNTGTVFAVEGNAGEPLAVVWITEDEEAL